jgi:tRNA 2-selenouridine synthase SelU
MGLIAKMIRNIHDEAKSRLGDLKLRGFSTAMGTGLSRVGTTAENKDLVVASFLWIDIARVFQVVIEQELRIILSLKLENEGKKTGDHTLARELFGSLSLRARSKDYDGIIQYATGEIDSEALIKAFELTEQRLREMNISSDEAGFIIVTLQKKLAEAWKEATERVDSLVIEQIDKLTEKLRSVEDDEQAISALRVTTEDILYNLHLRAWSKRP